MADAPAQAFTWGPNGQMLTPGEVAARRKVADAMIAGGMDYSPIRSPWQGAARIAQALMGGYESGQADRAEKAASDYNNNLIKTLAANLAGAGGAPAPVAQDSAAATGAPNPVAPSQPAVMGPDSPAVAAARPAVLPSARVWGDKEAEDAGLYEKPAPVTVAGAAPAVAAAAVPAASAQPTPAPPPAVVAPAPSGAPGPASAGVSTVANAMSPAALAAVTSPYASEQARSLGMLMLKQQMARNQPKHTQLTDAQGNVWDVDPATNERKVVLKASDDPTSVREYEYYTKNLPAGQKPMPYDAWSTAKARAAATNITNNVDMNSGQTYDKQLAEGLGKAHASLANGVEDAQSRARDVAAMQGAIDAIQRNKGSTGGLAPEAALRLQKAVNAGAAALGIDHVFDEKELSDKEFLTKFNRQMAGAQAKNAVGSRVTNFEMSNYLKANPGLDMSVTGNQRLLGIQAQIEQRNIAVGNAIRQATAVAISQGKKIDPVTVQKIVTDYDDAHHISDPVTGQDLTQSYVLPEFQQPGQGTNAALADRHNTNVGKLRTYNPATGKLE
nr:hypothetical protein [uncultured Bradyrhizobium sp.]